MTESSSTEKGGGSAPAKAARPRKMPSVDQLRGRQLGRILIKMGKLRRAQVEEALEIQKERRGPIGQIFVELGYILTRYIQGHTVAGWTSTLTVITLMFGIMFILIGILGMYIGEIVETLKNRPQFIVERNTDITNDT